MQYLRSRTSYMVRATSRTSTSVGATASADELPTPFASMFDFEKMTSAFEACHTHFTCTKSTLPTTTLFISAMQQLCYLFDTLGPAFTFVKSDVESKLVVLKRYLHTVPQHYSHLQSAIQYEMSEGVTAAHGFAWQDSPSFSRTLLRLMWALKFTDRLLVTLGNAFDDKRELSASERTLRWAVSTAYDDALAQHHSWTIRKTVKGACLLLPTKEAFMSRIGVKAENRQKYLQRLGVSMSPLVQRLYEYYDDYQLHALP
eukprot:TRINITY_DN616_c0_g2_i1.p1 TRINITY_DN616_c0_g2~~TRINITY_DN616_c0_g2_i1.p1  ORF type:complete len:258 (+),score=35.89 TRINITY_DN616_c0_g2_i1:1871-2644(+)